MNNVLSQSEIDNLLNALASGEDVNVSTPEETETNAVREYDFRTANKFNKEHMRTFGVIFDNFAYLLANRLTGLLRTLCEVEVVSVEEQKFGEYNNSISSPAILAIVDMKPLRGSILIEISSSVAYAIISRLFGGEADYGDTDKAFTEIEMSVSESIMREVLRLLKESWSKIVQVKPVLSRLETSPQFTQIVDMNEPAALVTLDVRIDKIQGMITLCMPHLAIQPVLNELNTMSWTMAQNALATEKDDKREVMENQLNNVEVTLTATFKDTTTTLREILDLRVGDTIRINHSIKDYITVKVEDMPKFKGAVGIFKNKYIVQVAKIIKENDSIE